ncbi:hypothetical protein K8R47_01830 [archaeon]|nr:hypothetical protein [archaeon]
MHNHFHVNLHNILRHKWNKEILEYYVYLILRNISFSIAILFIPVYLYVEVGYSLLEISAFFLILETFFVTLLPFSGIIIKKIGIKYSIILHLPFMALYWFLLRFLSGNFVNDFGLIIFMLFIYSFSKVPHGGADTFFIHKNILVKKHYGYSISKLKILIIIASLFAPFVGGLIIYFFGFNSLFNASIIILLLSGVPFLLTKGKHFKVDFKIKSFVSFTTHKISKNFFLDQFGRWFYEVALWVLWPLFIYLVVQNTAKLGFIVSVSSIIAIIVVQIIGKYLDKCKHKDVLKKTTKIAVSIFFLRTVFAIPIFLVIMDAINKIIEPILSVSYEKYMHEYMNKTGKLLEVSITTSYISSIAWFSGFALLTIYFSLLELFKINPGYWSFVVIFFVFGIPMILIPRIILAVKE